MHKFFLWNKKKLKKNKLNLEPFFGNIYILLRTFSFRLVTFLMTHFLLQHLNLAFIPTDGYL